QRLALVEAEDRIWLSVLVVPLGILKIEETPFAIQFDEHVARVAHHVVVTLARQLRDLAARHGGFVKPTSIRKQIRRVEVVVTDHLFAEVGGFQEALVRAIVRFGHGETCSIGAIPASAGAVAEGAGGRDCPGKAALPSAHGAGDPCTDYPHPWSGASIP